MKNTAIMAAMLLAIGLSAGPASGQEPPTQEAPEQKGEELHQLCASMGAAAPETARLMKLLVEKQILTKDEAEAICTEAAAEKQAGRVELVGQEFGYEPTAPLAINEGASIFVRRLGIETADGSERFRIRGRVQTDAAFQNFSDGMIDVARESNEFPKYGVILRRVRLGALGIMHGKWEWQLEADFSENVVDLANVYIAYLMDHGGRLAVGHFKEPFTMEYATSSRYISFIERSAASDAYKVDREPGVMYESIKPNWYMALGVFGKGIEYNRAVEEGYSLAWRGSFAPYLAGKDFIHVGGGYNHRKNSLDKVTDTYLPLRLRTREGTRAIDARLVGRDDIEGVKDFARQNLEFAAGFGSWWMQGEYIRVDLNLDPARGDVRIPDSSIDQKGWYLQTGYFLTGESKNYRAFSGDFGQQRPNRNFSPRKGEWGAFEVLARYSVADSLEHSRPGRGQKLEHYTLGLNWYFTPETMMKLNLMYMEGQRDRFTGDGWVFGVRFQYIF